MSQEAKSHPRVLVPTPYGVLGMRVVEVDGAPLLVASTDRLPDIPVVRFQSSCVFGEAFHAVDCDCGAQLTSAQRLICEHGGILIYAWEEGRGTGIVDKLRAIALQQGQNLSTAAAFHSLGHTPDPRTFARHISALKQTFDGRHIKLASANPNKISALQKAGYTVDRVKLSVPMTPERLAYLNHKKDYLGHLDDD